MTNNSIQIASKYVFFRLSQELDSNLYYHGIHHTKNHVLPAIETLSKEENISKEDFLLVHTAGLYHDLGYIYQYNKNEGIAEQIAKETLPEFGYSNAQIQRIGDIIRATEVQIVDGKSLQQPNENDLLQKIICDADLDSLGKDYFPMVSKNLRRELSHYGQSFDDKDWYQLQLKFLTNHNYFTQSAKKLWNEQKKINIQNIRKKLSEFD